MCVFHEHSITWGVLCTVRLQNTWDLSSWPKEIFTMTRFVKMKCLVTHVVWHPLSHFKKSSNYGERVGKFLFMLFAFRKSVLKHGISIYFDLLQIIGASHVFGKWWYTGCFTGKGLFFKWILRSRTSVSRDEPCLLFIDIYLWFAAACKLDNTNPFRTKLYMSNLKTKFVPRRKHSLPRL